MEREDGSHEWTTPEPESGMAQTFSPQILPAGFTNPSVPDSPVLQVQESTPRGSKELYLRLCRGVLQR